MPPLDGPNDVGISSVEEDRATPVANRAAPVAGKVNLPLADFHRLVEAELAYLRKAARRWHREPANTADLVHATVLQALANAHQWQPGSSLRAWLFTIMRHQFFANAARVQRSVQALDVIATAAFGHRTCEPETRLVIRDVQRALGQLPAAQQTAIRLIGIEGRSYDEAALLMGTSIGAVRCHLARGRERLRTIVHGDEVRSADRGAAQPQGKNPAPALAPA